MKRTTTMHVKSLATLAAITKAHRAFNDAVQLRQSQPALRVAVRTTR